MDFVKTWAVNLSPFYLVHKRSDCYGNGRWTCPIYLLDASLFLLHHGVHTAVPLNLYLLLTISWVGQSNTIWGPLTWTLVVVAAESWWLLKWKCPEPVADSSFPFHHKFIFTKLEQSTCPLLSCPQESWLLWKCPTSGAAVFIFLSLTNTIVSF